MLLFWIQNLRTSCLVAFLLLGVSPSAGAAILDAGFSEPVSDGSHSHIALIVEWSRSDDYPWVLRWWNYYGYYVASQLGHGSDFQGWDIASSEHDGSFEGLGDLNHLDYAIGLCPDASSDQGHVRFYYQLSDQSWNYLASSSAFFVSRSDHAWADWSWSSQ